MKHTLARLSQHCRGNANSLVVALACFAVLSAATVGSAQQASKAVSAPIQPVGLRHKLGGFGNYITGASQGCVECQPGYATDMAPAQEMPSDGSTPQGTDYSQYQQPSDTSGASAGSSEPTASNFGFANTMGDNFGGGVGNNVTFRLDSLQVQTEFYSQLPASPSPINRLQRFSATPVPFYIVDPAHNTSSIATTGTAGFTTTQSEQVAIAAMALFGHAPIFDDATYRALAEAEFHSRTGTAAGTTTFNPGASGVGIVTPLVLPSFIDLNGNGTQESGEFSVLGNSTSAFIDVNGNTIQDSGEPFYTPPVLLDQIYAYDYLVSASLASPGTGGRVGRSKLSENSSPVPRDRLFFNYSGFYGVDFGTPSDVHRFTPGFEKTFGGGRSSLEVRFPMASALTADSNVDSSLSNSSDLQFGNLTVYFKTILSESRYWVWSGGIGVALPTADDSRLLFTDGTPLIQIENEAIHYLPFVAFGYAPGEHFFMEGFCQFDIDGNGNPVQVTDFNDGLDQIGVAQDANFAFYSLAMGYWTTRQPGRLVTRIAPMVELHYNDPLQDTDIIANDFVQIGTSSSDFETFNIVVGTVFEMNDGAATLHIGYVDELLGDEHHQFNSELRVLWNSFF